MILHPRLGSSIFSCAVARVRVCHQHLHERSERGSPRARLKAEPSAFFIEVFAPSGSRSEPEAEKVRRSQSCILEVHCLRHPSRSDDVSLNQRTDEMTSISCENCLYSFLKCYLEHYRANIY